MQLLVTMLTLLDRFIIYVILLIACLSSGAAGVMNFNMNHTLCVRDYIVSIEVDDQMILMEEEKIKCASKIAKTFVDKTDHCPLMWDKVVCWPETKVNTSIYLPCPKYINKFNTLNKAVKHCEYDPVASRAHWSKTNYQDCMAFSAKDYCDLTSCSMENHMSYIIIMRVCGYVASMFTLVFSIMILLRPKLRCPRNYVHINLFVAFALRTVLVIIVDRITRESPFTLAKKNSTSRHVNNQQQQQPDHQLNDVSYNYEHIPCQTIMVIFRYSGSVYHTAILSEALYLVLLLKYPYYSELKGSRFCILISWALPILWMIPWTLSRVFIDSYWCWQAESETNIIIKIPHTILLILNIVCAVFIINVLYTKMRFRNMNKEKIKKYRRLAKSILILIPIFGLHFIFFAWLPYTNLVGIEIGECFELVVTYIEIFFNAFQGFVVSVTTCLIHQEVRIECILFCVEILREIKCLRSLGFMNCLDSDYIRQMRYFHLDPRGASTNAAAAIGVRGPASTTSMTITNGGRGGGGHCSLLNLSQVDEEDNPMLSPPPSTATVVAVDANNTVVTVVVAQPKPSASSRLKPKRGKSKKFENSDNPSPTSNKHVLITSTQSVLEQPNYSGDPVKCCICLFGTQKNDFFDYRANSINGGGRRRSLSFRWSNAGTTSGGDGDADLAPQQQQQQQQRSTSGRRGLLDTISCKILKRTKKGRQQQKQSETAVTATKIESTSLLKAATTESTNKEITSSSNNSLINDDADVHVYIVTEPPQASSQDSLDHPWSAPDQSVPNVIIVVDESKSMTPSHSNDQKAYFDVDDLESIHIETNVVDATIQNDHENHSNVSNVEDNILKLNQQQQNQRNFQSHNSQASLTDYETSLTAYDFNKYKRENRIDENNNEVESKPETIEAVKELSSSQQMLSMPHESVPIVHADVSMKKLDNINEDPPIIKAAPASFKSKSLPNMYQNLSENSTETVTEKKWLTLV